jgi:ADP-ribose pyrophosphatase
MVLTPLRPLDTRVLDTNPYWQYRVDIYRASDGSERPYYYVHTHGSVMIIPITDDGRLVLVRQYRYLWQQESLEFPGGGIPAGATADEQAQRELEEEAGYRAGSLLLVGTFNPMNGVTTERCSVLVAQQLQPTTRATDPAEETEPVLVTFSQMAELIARGSIWDGMTLAAWALFVGTHRPEINAAYL